MSEKPAAVAVVLGASGFIGRGIVRGAVGRGFKAVALHRGAAPSLEGGVPLCCDDGLERALVRAGELGEIDAIFHAAGRINGTAAQLRADNVTLTEALLSAIVPLQRRPRLVYLSSVSAIGPTGVYGAAKRAAEEAIFRSDHNAVVLRPSLVYGPNEHANVAGLVGAVKHWPLIPAPGGRRVKLQPLYVEDLVDAAFAAARPEVQAGRYVVAGPRQEPLPDMIRIIQGRLGKRQPVIAVPLAPLQWGARTATTLAPWLPLPMQQIASLHDHPAWSNAEASAAFGFTPRTFEVGVAAYL